MQSVVALPYLGLAVLAAGDMGQGKAAGGRILLPSSQFGQSPDPPTFFVSFKGYVNLALQFCLLGRSGEARIRGFHIHATCDKFYVSPRPALLLPLKLKHITDTGGIQKI